MELTQRQTLGEKLVIIFGSLSTHGFYTWVCRGVFLANLTILIASMSHVAWAYNRFEKPEDYIYGWLAAFGLEVGNLFTMLGMGQTVASKNYFIFILLIPFALWLLYLNTYCNYTHALYSMIDTVKGVDLEALPRHLTSAQINRMDEAIIDAAIKLGSGLPVTNFVMNVVYSIFSAKKKSEKEKNKSDADKLAKKLKGEKTKEKNKQEGKKTAKEPAINTEEDLKKKIKIPPIQNLTVGQ